MEERRGEERRGEERSVQQNCLSKAQLKSRVLLKSTDAVVLAHVSR
jgi:hypothetical protein